MTNERIPEPERQYKQMVVVCKNLNKVMYTQCKMCEDDYMAISPIWQMLKDKVKARDNYKCRICGSEMQLCVHHTRYPDVWGEENPDDLITVCDNCHKTLHRRTGENR